MSPDLPAAEPEQPLPPGSAVLVHGARRRLVVLAILAVVAGAAAVSLSGTAAIGERLASGRPGWLIVAVGFELMSVLGFVAIFQLAFGEWLPRRLSLRMGLAVCAATILVPAGGLIAIGVGARALRRRGMSSAKMRSRAIAFLLVTNAPNVIVLGMLGIALGAGLLAGPHAATLTLVPAAIALSAVAFMLVLPTVSHHRAAPVRDGIAHRVVSVVATELELGVIEAITLLRAHSWKLLGAVAYYAFDNAVLWATFRSFGHVRQPFAVLVMAYVIGSAAGSLPVPAGIGVVEGGMIGLLVLFGAPAICAGIAVLAYRAVSTGVPLAAGGVSFLTLGKRGPGTPSPSARRRRPRRRPLTGGTGGASAHVNSVAG
ncbi:MAG TPA: YbhN family protein [Solirubrobacteraceae bacterium]|nr:YbhN family protein [Solirubrobacteraceae bacterium]